MTAIVNPGSGSGTARNPDYARAIADLRAAGGRVLGYVPSGYSGRRVAPGSTCRPAAGPSYTVQDVVACARRYQTFYGTIDGIFVDEMGLLIGDTPGSDVTFYRDVYNGLKAIDAAWLVVGNPGAVAPESYLRNGANGGADVLVMFEGLASSYFVAPTGSFVYNYASSRFGDIIYGAAPGTDFNAVFMRASLRNASYLYVTDDNGSNPYDTLPTYWEAEVAAALVFNRR